MRRLQRPVHRSLSGGLYIVANHGRVIRFSRQDRAVVEAATWTAVHVGRGNYYAATNVRDDDGTYHRLYLHQALGFFGGDHINGDGLDCRRTNLRQATYSQNLANRGKGRRLGATSKYKGVARTPGGSWCVLCGPVGSNRYVGTYRDEVVAALHYDERAAGDLGRLRQVELPQRRQPSQPSRRSRRSRNIRPVRPVRPSRNCSNCSNCSTPTRPTRPTGPCSGGRMSADDIVRVGNSSVASAVAHSISEQALDMRANDEAIDITVAVVGSHAVGVAVKALAIARGTLASHGIDICLLPAFLDATGNNGESLSVQTLRMIERRL